MGNQGVRFEDSRSSHLESSSSISRIKEFDLKIDGVRTWNQGVRRLQTWAFRPEGDRKDQSRLEESKIVAPFNLPSESWFSALGGMCKFAFLFFLGAI